MCLVNARSVAGEDMISHFYKVWFLPTLNVPGPQDPSRGGAFLHHSTVSMVQAVRAIRDFLMTPIKTL